MARQSKKIAKKIQPKKKTESENKPVKEKVGKDYLLIFVLSLTIVFLLVGWSNTALNRGLYIALLVSLSTTYARRHYNFSEVQDMWLERTGLAAMFLSIVFFALVVYNQYFA